MASEETQPIKGMSDITTPEIHAWQALEQTARALFHRYGLSEIRTPLLEREELFIHALGDTTDVVQKEMFTLDYQGKMRLTLRPEGTAGVIRHLAGLGPEGMSARVYYMGPMFRAERPQAGRRRQFHQIGVELTGEPNALADAECIAMQAHLLREWGLTRCRIRVNTRGLPEDRPAIADGLRRALQPHEANLCDDCRRRMGQNILRVLDCKQETCGAIVRALPPMTDFMAEASRAYFEDVKKYLVSLELDAEVEPRLVRGLDYYAHTVWEITHPGLGAQDALSGGGRYQIAHGSKIMQGVGFAMGVERLLAALESERGAPADLAPRPAAWLISLGERALLENMRLAMALRQRGVACGMEPSPRSMKAQMRAASKARAAFAVIRGDTELDQGLHQVKNLDDGTQEQLDLPSLMLKLSR